MTTSRPPSIPCVTCGDVAERGAIIALGPGSDAMVAFESGVRRTVAIDLVPGLEPGDVVLVHGGAAIGRVGDP